MNTADAVQHFGNQSAVARALGISPAAVSKWPSVVPLESAMALAILSGGALTVDQSQYPGIARALNSADKSAA